MMANNNNYFLRLEEFDSNIRRTWKQLQNEMDFCDVILACDGKVIKAHKIILSSCSPVFKNILQQFSKENTIIYLKGVKYKEMENILNFIYQGEVSIAKEDLEDFLEMGKDLKIKGLVLDNDTSFEFPQHQNKEVLKDFVELKPQDLPGNNFINTFEGFHISHHIDNGQNEKSKIDVLEATGEREMKKPLDEKSGFLQQQIVLDNDRSFEFPQHQNKEVLKEFVELKPHNFPGNNFINTFEDFLGTPHIDIGQNEKIKSNVIDATGEIERDKILEKKMEFLQQIVNLETLQSIQFKEENIEKEERNVSLNLQTNIQESKSISFVNDKTDSIKDSLKRDKDNEFHKKNKKPSIKECDKRKKKPTIKVSDKKKKKPTIKESDKDMILTCSLCSKEFPSNYLIKSHLLGRFENGKLRSGTGIHGNEGFYLWNQIKGHNKIISSGHHVKYRIKNVSSFTIEKIESFLEKKLQSKELDLYSGLIRDGKDMEIFSNVFQTNFTKVKERIWKCDQCINKKFIGNLENYISHFEVHKTKTISFNCELCKLKTLKYKMYKSHLCNYHFTDYKCDICGDILRSKNLHTSHMNTVHEIEEHRCNICNKIFPQKGSMELHLRTVHNDPKYLCPGCGKYFKTNNALQVHIKAIHNTETYKCDHCDGIYNSQPYLKRHMKEMHDTLNKKKYICDICGNEEFSKRSYVDSHIRRVHNQEKNVGCELCDRKFFHKSSMKVHMTSHSSKTHYDCHLCNKSVKTYNSLKRHVMHMHKQKAPTKRLYHKKYSTLRQKENLNSGI